MKYMIGTIGIVCSLAYTPAFAVEWCSGYNSPGNTYGHCEDNPKGEGNCVWWAAYKRPDLNFPGGGRDAREGMNLANRYGLPTGNEPRVDSVVVFPNGEYGHVAYVESLNNDGSFNVTEMGWDWFDGMRQNTYSISSLGGVLGFIYRSRTILYNRHQVDGILAVSGEGGGPVNSCDDVNRATLFAVDDVKKEIISYVADSSEYAKLLCQQAEASWGLYDMHLGERAPGYANGGIGGYNGSLYLGSGSTAVDNPITHQPIPNNLTQDTDIFGPEGVERKAEKGHGLYAGETITVRTEICAEDGDTAKARQKGGDKTDTVFEVKLPGGDWQEFASAETKDTNLKKDECHVEKATYTIPHFTGSQIGFRARIDARDEIRETDEGDNQGRNEMFAILDPPTYNFITHSLQFLQAPRYAGDSAKLKGAVVNNGTVVSPKGIRSAYSVQCPGTSRIKVADDGSDANELTPGRSQWEQTNTAFAMPNVVGNCTAYFCADESNAVAETDEADNCSSLRFTLTKRPLPNFTVDWAADKKGCCTTKRGKKLYPRAGIANRGQSDSTGTIEVRYYIKGPGTGNQWRDIGNVDHVSAGELRAGAARVEEIKSGWKVPKWGPKKEIHTIKVCINPRRTQKESNYNDNCKTYWRMIK